MLSRSFPKLNNYFFGGTLRKQTISVLSFRVERKAENFYVSIQDRISFGLYICCDRTSNLTEFQNLSTELPTASPVDRSSNWKLSQDIFTEFQILSAEFQILSKYLELLIVSTG